MESSSQTTRASCLLDRRPEPAVVSKPPLTATPLERADLRVGEVANLRVKLHHTHLRDYGLENLWRFRWCVIPTRVARPSPRPSSLDEVVRLRDVVPLHQEGGSPLDEPPPHPW